MLWSSPRTAWRKLCYGLQKENPDSSILTGISGHKSWTLHKDWVRRTLSRREAQIKDYINNQCELVTLLRNKCMYFSAEEIAYLREQFGTKSGMEFVQRVQEKLLAGHDFLVRSQSRGVKSPKLHSAIHNTSSSSSSS